MTQEIFTKIFKQNLWGSDESISGPGSELRNTINLRNDLRYLIKTLRISSILDVPCGDMNWMSKVDLENVRYEGWDIVEDLINKNNRKFCQCRSMKFFCKDALSDLLIKSDLIISRDMLIHFPFLATWKFLENVVCSGSKYLLTSFCDTSAQNINIQFGKYYPVNLEKPPFNLGRALFYIKEEEPNKYMALYKVEQIRCHVKYVLKNHELYDKQN